jgi:ficolin
MHAITCCAAEQILIQQHYNGVQFFHRTWNQFKTAFGNQDGNYWIGNELLHKLTSTGRYHLHIDMQSATNGKMYSADYQTFKVGPASDGYRLSIGGYSGTAGDSLASLDRMKFTTRDRDNDFRANLNCAEFTKGGFWYYSCTMAPLNGIYKTFAEGGFFWASLPVSGTRRRLNFDRMFLVGDSVCDVTRNACLNGGLCVVSADHLSYTCQCKPGFKGDSCADQDIPDPCASNPCLNGGTCQTQGNEFECQCADGFAGEHCQKDEAECKKTPPEERINCGWGGVTSSECSQRSCCYDTTYSNRPFCYYQASECGSIAATSRVDCGFDGISYPQCIGRGCCFDDDPDTNPSGPVCFRKGNTRCVGIPASRRMKQGDATIHPNVCLANGWCFDTSAEPNCFSV